MKKVLVILLHLNLLLTTILSAQPGQAGLAFLKLGVGARALGMGEAYSAVASDPTATYYNVARLTQGSASQLLFMHKEWIQDVKTEYIAGMTSFENVSFGFSVNATSVNNIELRTTPGPPIGAFSARDAALGLSFAYALDPTISVGLTGRYLYEKILIDESSGLGFDFGATYRTPWSVDLAVAVNNLGSVSDLNAEAPILPRIIRIGGAYESSIESIDGQLTVSSDFLSVTGESKAHLHVGTELEYKKLFAIRIGYQTGYEAKNFSTGIGIRQGLFQIDYAFVPFRYDLGTTHTFSLGVNFQ